MSERRVIPIFGEPVEVVVSSASTQNAFCVLLQTSPPGGGPPVHIHTREDEFFHILEGDYHFYDGERWIAVGKGQSCVGMRGRPHAFRNTGRSEGRMLVVVTPGGLDAYFTKISPLALPRDADRLADINRMYGVTFLPPGTVREP